MLGLIAQFAPSLFRNEIIKRSTNLAWIWQRIRGHFNFVQPEVNFFNLAHISRKPDECYETFYQRIVAHLEDNLLTVATGLHHDEALLTVDEGMSPTTERLAGYLWLSLIDNRLPAYNLRQNICNKIEKSTKSRREKKCLISTFACFLTAIAKV